MATLTTEIVSVNPVSDSYFVVEDHVTTVDCWQGERLPPREWRPGDVAFLPGGTELSSRPNRAYRENVVSLDSQLLIQRIRDYLESQKAQPRYAPITSHETTHGARLLHQLVASGEFQAWPLLTDCMVLALAVAVASKMSPAGERAFAKPHAHGLNKARTQRVVDFVEANLSNPIRLEAMAESASLSQFHFIRSFKREMGVSPTRYVLQRRIRHAQMLLKTTGLTLAAIAHECGFASQSHFTGAFKAATGTTPAKFREVIFS